MYRSQVLLHYFEHEKLQNRVNVCAGRLFLRAANVTLESVLDDLNAQSKRRGFTFNLACNLPPPCRSSLSPSFPPSSLLLRRKEVHIYQIFAFGQGAEIELKKIMALILTGVDREVMVDPMPEVTSAARHGTDRPTPPPPYPHLSRLSLS